MSSKNNISNNNKTRAHRRRSVNILEGPEGSEEVVGTGLILQSSVSSYRESRGGVDVVVGEVLTGYAQRVRDDGKVDVGLEPVGRRKREGVAEVVRGMLEGAEGGVLPVGDRSDVADIKRLLGEGVSKSKFKTAIGMLYKEGVIERPGKTEIRLSGTGEGTAGR